MPSVERSDEGSLLDFAEKLQKRLVSGLIDQQLCEQIRSAIAAGTHGHKSSKRSFAQFDQKGVQIWNLGTRLVREETGNVPKTLPLIRAFALFLLRVAFHSSGNKDAHRSEATVRILRTSLKAAKTCIEASELDLATDILQNAADYTASFAHRGRSSTISEEEPIDSIARDLVAEYWLARVALAWKQDRLDLAETHFKQISSEPSTGKEIKAKVADLAYEIGKDLLKHSGNEDCVAWLEEGSKFLDRIPDDELDSEMLELRTSISQEMAKAFVREGTEQSCNRAADLISYLENEHGLKLGVLLLKVDLLYSRGTPEAAEHHAIISQMIRKVVISHNTFKAIIIQIRKLQDLSASLARDSLELLLTTRLLEHGDASFIEGALAMLLWIYSTLSADDLQSLHDLMDLISASLSTGLSNEATHAAQILCWRCIDQAIQARRQDVAQTWCRLAGHRLFANAGDANKSKIARKLMTVTLNDNKTSIAREAFYQMPKSGQDAPQSQYLLYRAALRDSDETLASECLANLVRHPHADVQLLYACAQEAQQHNSREYAFAALQKITDRAKIIDLQGFELFPTIRCMIQILLGEIDNHNGDAEAHLSSICSLLQTAATSVGSEASDGNKGSLHLELEWFARTSYNTAITHMAKSDPNQTLKVIDSCVKFTQQLLLSEDPRKGNETRRRILTCHCVGASACAVLARSESQIVTMEEHYNKLLLYTTAFSDNVRLVNPEEIQDGDDYIATSKRSLLRLEIEALLMLKQFERLDKVLEQCLNCIDGDDLETLADLIISVHTVMIEQSVDSAYTNKIPTVLQAIINQSWKHGKSDMTKLARWLRCIFRMTSTTNPEVAQRILGQAASIAGGGGLRRESHRYPTAELEWLASTAFNLAVDRFVASDSQSCQAWAEAALNLAKSVTESPQLYAQMQGSWLRLQAQMH